MARYTAPAATCKGLVKKYHLRTERGLLASNNVSAFYKHINNKMSCSQGSVPIRAEDGTILQYDASKACAFNAYFASVFNDNISRTIPPVRSNNKTLCYIINIFINLILSV